MAEQTMDYDLKFDANTQKAINKINELSKKTHELTDKEHIVKFGAKIDISDQAIQKVSAKIQQSLKKTSVAPEITFDRIKLDEEKIKNSFASLRRQIQNAIKNQFSKIPPIDLTVNVSDSFKNLSKVASGLTQISNAAKGLSQTNIDKIKDFLTSLSGFDFSFNSASFNKFISSMKTLSGVTVNPSDLSEIVKFVRDVSNLNVTTDFTTLASGIKTLSRALSKVTSNSNVSYFAIDVNELVKLDSKIKGINASSWKTFGQAVLDLANAVKKISTTKKTSSFTTRLDDLITAMQRANTQHIDSFARSMNNLANALTHAGTVVHDFSSLITQINRLSRIQLSRDLVRNVNRLFDAFSRGLQRLTNLQQLIRDLTNLVPAIMRLATYLRQCNNAINGLNRAIGGSRRNLDGFGNSARRAGEGFNFLTRSMQSTISDIRRVAALVYVVQNSLNGLKTVAEQLDRLNVVKNKLRGLYEDEQMAADVTEMIYNSAQDARTSMDAFSTTFLKVQLATEKYGFSAQEAVDMTNTLAKALTIGGATASETASVMLQMSQALSKGKLDGDEFRSVMENSPVLMRALAREAGKAMGVVGAGQKELMQWSRTGKLTIDILLNALKNMKGEMDRKFNGTTETITQAFAKLDNAWEKFIGTFAEEGSLETIRDIIGDITRIMEKWGRGIIDVGGKIVMLTGSFLALKLAGHAYNAVTQAGIMTQQKKLSVMSGELVIEKQLDASAKRITAAMSQTNAVMTKQEMIRTRLTEIDARQIQMFQFLQRNYRLLTATERQYIMTSMQALAVERQRVVALGQNASAVRGLKEAYKGLQASILAAGKSVIGFAGFLSGLFVLNEILNLWTQWVEVTEQTERALKGNIDAITKFGKGGDLEGWQNFYEILKGISGIDFGNLKDIDEGASNYLKFKMGLISREEFEQLQKKQDKGVSGDIEKGMGWLSSVTPQMQWLDSIAQKVGGFSISGGLGEGANYFIAKSRADETVKSGEILARAIKDTLASSEFAAAMSKNRFDAYGEKQYDSRGFEVMKTDVLEVIKDQEAFLNGAGKDFLSKLTDTMQMVSTKGTGVGVLNEYDRQAYALVTGMYATLQDDIRQNKAKPEEYTAVVEAIQRLADRFATVDWSRVTTEYKDQEAARIEFKNVQLFNETIKQAAKTMMDLGMSYDKMQHEIAGLVDQSVHIAEMNQTKWTEEFPKLLPELVKSYTGQDNAAEIQQRTDDAERARRNALQGLIEDGNTYITTYAQWYDTYVLKTQLWTDKMGNAWYGMMNNISQSVKLTSQEIDKLISGIDYNTLITNLNLRLKGENKDLRTKGEENSENDKKGSGGGRHKGVGGGGGHKDEFKIDWLNMVGLGGNIYDSYHPSKVLKTFEEAVPGGNRNLIGVDRDAEKWYEEVAKIKEQALEKGVKLTEQDYAELKTLWDQRQELEKILDVKRQITDDINKPMEEYENQKKALEQLIAQMQALGRDTSLYEKKLRECRKPMEELGKAFAEGLQKNMLSDFGRDVFDRFEKLLEAWEKQEKKAADRPQIEKLMKQAQIEEFKLKASQKEGELTWGEGGEFWAANMGLRAENLGTLRAYNRGNLSQGAMASFMRDNLAKYNAYSGAFGRTEDGAGFLSSMGLDPNEWNDWALRGLEAVSKLTEGFSSLGESITESLGSALTTFTDGLADGIAGAIVKGEDLRETMNNVAQSILTNIISAIIKMGIQWAATQLMMSIIGDTMKKKEEVSNAESAAVIAAEWATAATYVSTATMGGAVAAGESALLTALATNQGLAFTGFADGGYTGNGDKYDPAGIVHKGEYVFTQDDVKRIGLNNLEMMHRGSDSVTNAGLNNNRASATEQRSSSVSIVNMVDPDMLKAYLSTPDGQRAIINTIRHNPKTVKQIVTTA